MNPILKNLTGAALLAALLLSGPAIDSIDDVTTEMTVATEKSAARMAEIQSRREWQARVSICHRAFGPQTEPTEDQDGNFFCQDARGRKVAAK